jgi:hypothetical protein
MFVRLLPAFLLLRMIAAGQEKLFERNQNFTASTLQSALIPYQVRLGSYRVTYVTYESL